MLANLDDQIAFKEISVVKETNEIIMYKKQTLLFLLLTLLFTFHINSTAYADFEEAFGEFTDDSALETLFKNKSDDEKSYSQSDTSKDILVSKKTLKQIEKQIAKLEKITKSGGWPTLKRKGQRIKHEDKNGQVAILKKLLVKQGDLALTAANIYEEFDHHLEDAVIRFQKRHGLKETGYVNRLTRLAMSIPAKTRLKQLRLNRLRIKQALVRKRGKRYITVNIPGYSLQAINNDKVELSSRVVVGRIDRQTPVMNTKIYGVNFNPFWHVPRKLVIEDLIPLQQKNPKFLEEQHLRIFDSKGKKVSPSKINWKSASARNYLFRQDPGKHNALGLIRIHMPNAGNIFLHDTPTKKLYGLRARAYSAGCVRVERINDLAGWIINNKSKWSKSNISDVLESKKRKDVMIKKSIPVQIVYITAWASSDGTLHFRDDIYKKDKGLVRVASKENKPKVKKRLTP